MVYISERKNIFCVLTFLSLLMVNALLMSDDVWGMATPENSIVRIPLIVSNTLQHKRIQEPVTSGVPVPVDYDLSSIDNLVLTKYDGITQVPAQFRIISRWGALNDEKKPIKWLLVDFQADAAENGKSTYYLTRGISKPMRSAIRVVENSEKVSIDTGMLAFAIRKDRFDLLSEIVVRNAGEKRRYKGHLKESIPDGIVIRRDNTIYASSYGKPDVVKIEDKGPLRATILVRGKLYSAKGTAFVGGEARRGPDKDGRPASQKKPLEYTVRIHAFHGKDFVRVVYTLENNGNGLFNYYPTNDVFIDENYLQLSLEDLDSFRSFSQGEFQDMSVSDSQMLVQQYAANKSASEEENFRYRLLRNGFSTKSGNRAEGYLNISDGKGGVTVGIQYFWQKYPKSIGIEKGKLRIGLLPGGDAKPERRHHAKGIHYFSGGWHMTNEILFQFYLGAQQSDSVVKTYSGFRTPLFARCTSEWYAKTNAWGLIAPRGVSSPNRMVKKAIDLYERYQSMFVEKTASSKGRTIEVLRETRNLGKGHYGWENFGDMVWKWKGGKGPFCALHYDWPYIMWLQYIRTGDERYRKLAREMTAHSIDMDQIHSNGQRDDGIWWWEAQADSFGHHKSNRTAGLIGSHTWNGGYALGYLLSGNTRYFEAAGRGASAARRIWRKALRGEKVVQNQTRSQGWSILMLVNYYKITGDLRFLKDAMKIFENSLLHTERLPQIPGSNGRGYITSTGGGQYKSFRGKVVVTMATYPLEPISELHYEAKRAGMNVLELENYIIRALNWLKDVAYVGGQLDGRGDYSYLTLSYVTDPTNTDGNTGGSLAHNIHVAGAFGYGYLMLKASKPGLGMDYLDFARRIFKDIMFYRTKGDNSKDKYHPINHLSPVGWGHMQTATKELGYIGRGGQFYLNAEYGLSDIKSAVPKSPLNLRISAH